MTLITGILGITILVVFLGVLLWWIKSLPLTIVVVGVILLLLYDFVHTLQGEGRAR